MKITQENFVQELKGQNEEALQYLMEEYGDLLKAIVCKNLSDAPHYQEECLNDVFLKIWRYADQFDETKGSFKNWAVAVCKFRTIDYLRKQVREKRDILTEDIEYFGREGKDIEANREVDERIEQLLEPLCEKDRILFRKIYLENRSVRELAEVFNVKESWIYNRISRGKERIRKFFKEGGERFNE